MTTRPPLLRSAAAPALALAALALAALALACGGGADPAARGPRAVVVRAAPAATRDVPIEVRAVGRIVSNQSVAIRAQVSGPITAVHFTEGQAVRRGDPLLEIDPRPYRAALGEARARLAQNRARAENARADAERLAGLVEKEYVTRQQFDAARANAAALEAAVTADEAALEKATLDLSYTRIVAPIAGRTGRLLVHVGNLVSAQAQTPLLTIEQTRPVHVAFSVPERHLAALRSPEGGPPPIRVLPGEGSAPIAGALDFVDNAVDPATGTILLRARVPNEDERLWPGQVVEVWIRVAERKGAVVVPASAVAQGQQGDYAYVVGEDRRAELRQVVVDQAGDAEAVIAKGIAAGELVVVEGQLKLRPGDPVELAEGGKAAPGT